MAKLTQDELLEFEHLQTELKIVKKKEIELRNKIIKHFRYGDKVEGVQHKSLEGVDIDIAVTLKLSRSLDADGLDMIWSDLTEEQRDAITYKPSLDVKKFKQMVENDTAGELINVVIEKPAQATVALKFE